MSPREQKIAMRSRVNERLAVMSDQERSLASMDLCARLADCTHELDGFIFAFIPMAMEVDIRPFLQNRLPGNMAVPLVDWDNRTMEPCRLHGLTDAELTRDRHGLRTPVRSIVSIQMKSMRSSFLQWRSMRKASDWVVVADTTTVSLRPWLVARRS